MEASTPYIHHFSSMTSSETGNSAEAIESCRLHSALRNVFFETLWPTRCALCDTPGSLLCESCRLHLPYIDRWSACNRCGAAFGVVQCTECNPVTLTRIERNELPFTGCASVTLLTAQSRRLVTLCKDAGERRLANVMAQLMVQVINPSWLSRISTITWIPARKTAIRRRGFDHAHAIALEVSSCIGLPVYAMLEQPNTHDQRVLSRIERFENTRSEFQILASFDKLNKASHVTGVMLIDDVYTTGATLFAASDALKKAGVSEIFCLTFARAL